MTCRILLCSDTGHTRKVGEELAWELGAQLHEIDCPMQDAGVLRRVGRGARALLSGDPAPEVPDQPWDRSDMLILGTPACRGRPARPLRQWLESHPALPDRVALLITSADRDYPAQAVSEMTDLIGRAPVAVLHISETDLAQDAWKGRIQHFLDQCLLRYRQSA